MQNEAIYTSAMTELSVAFQDIIAYNDKNQPVPRKSLLFKNGMKKLDLTTEEGKILEKLLDDHPLNISNGGSITTGFKKQKDDITRIQILADGEVYCSMPDDGMQEADTEAIEYLNKMSRVLPKTALKNTITKSVYIYDRFSFAGLPRIKEGNSLKIVKARVTEMVEALIEKKIWGLDDDIEGETTAGKDSAED